MTTQTDPPVETTTTVTTTTTTTVPETTTTTEPEPTIEIVPDDSAPDAESTTTLGPIEDPEIPVNTMFDPNTVEGEIEQVVLAEDRAYAECLRQLPSCDVDSVVRFGALEYADGTRSFLERFNSLGLVAESVDTLRTSVVGIAFPAVSVEAEVRICVNDSTRIFDPVSGAVVEDATGEVTSSNRLLVLDRIGDQWLITGSNQIDISVDEAVDLCAS